MNEYYRKYLFQHDFLVNETGTPAPDAAEVLLLLAQNCGIKVTGGVQFASRDMVEFASSMLGKDVPEPFYRGFPESVRELAPEQLLFDQLIHYFNTYGIGDFSEAGHSLLEEFYGRGVFEEDVTPMEFTILTGEEAEAILMLTPRGATEPVMKVLKSASANAQNNLELNPDDLYVAEADADQGPTLMRYRPRAHGRASRIRKRTSHITIVLDQQAK